MLAMIVTVVFCGGTCWCQPTEDFQTLAPTETQTLEPTEEDSLPTAAPSVPAVSPTQGDDAVPDIAIKAKDGPIEEFEPRFSVPDKQQTCRIRQYDERRKEPHEELEEPKREIQHRAGFAHETPTQTATPKAQTRTVYVRAKPDTKSILSLINGWTKRAGATARSYTDRRDERVLKEAKEYANDKYRQLSQELGGVKQTQQQQKRAIKLVNLRETEITIVYLIAYVVLLCLIVKIAKLCLRQPRRH